MDFYNLEKNFWTEKSDEKKIYVSLNGNHDDLYKGHCYVIYYVSNISDPNGTHEYDYYIGDLEFPDVKSTLIVAPKENFISYDVITRTRDAIVLQSKVR